MGEMDIAFRHLTQRRPEDLAWLIFGEEVNSTSTETHVPTMSREVDFAAKIEKPGKDPFLLHVECQSTVDWEISFRMVEYHVRLLGREEIPVLSVLIELRGKQKARRTERYKNQANGMDTLDFRYPVINLARLDVEELRNAGRVGLLALVPLCRGGKKREKIKATLRQVREAPNMEKSYRADILVGLAVFAGAQGVSRNWIWSLIRREEMQESVMYSPIFQEGKAESILRILKHRFENVPDDLQEQVGKTSDTDTLDRWFDLAMDCSVLEHFVNRM